MFYEKCFRFQLFKKSNTSGLLPLPASFFKVLPLPQKFNRLQVLHLCLKMENVTLCLLTCKFYAKNHFLLCLHVSYMLITTLSYV